MTCERAWDRGCESCSAMLTLRPRSPQLHAGTCDVLINRDSPPDCEMADGSDDARVVPLSLLAFIGPLIAGMATVSCFERVEGAAMAAAAGLAAAGLTAVVSAVIVRGFFTPAGVKCSDPDQSHPGEGRGLVLHDGPNFFGDCGHSEEKAPLPANHENNR